ncbi:MAG: DUF2339 domain-containing protein [Pseudohongiella sp.]|nr:DUF2339 domain-containing protein [Pseudohongiella sp.]
MTGLILIFIILAFAVISKLGNIQRELESLKRKVAQLEEHTNAVIPVDVVDAQAADEVEPEPDPWIATVPAASAVIDPTLIASAETETTGQRKPFSIHDWMVWIGGLSLAIAGVFLVRYSMDAGLLGPRVRVGLGLLTGLVLHGVAEFLRRKHNRPFESLAALAGGASAFLFAALLAGLHLYDLFPASAAFLLLTLVALATMWLALLHGPVLAILGMLGAYAVPLLVGSDNGSIASILLYATIITTSCFLLMMHVYRTWLWFGMVTGALGWWLISSTMGDITALQHGYLLAFAIACLYQTMVRDKHVDAEPGVLVIGPDSAQHPLPLLATFACILFAYVFSLAGEAGEWPDILLTLPMIGAFAFAATRYHAVEKLVLVLQPLHVLFWLASADFSALSMDTVAPAPRSLIYAMMMTGIFVSIGLYFFRRPHAWRYWLEMILVTPMLWFLATRLLSTGAEWSAVWGIWTALGGAIYLAAGLFILRKHAAWKHNIDPALLHRVAHGLYVIAIAAYLLAATDIWEQSHLTLAMASALILIAGLQRHFPSTHLRVCLKLVMALVLTSVMASPLIYDYSADTHWTLTGVHGPSLCALFALLWLRRAGHNTLDLQRWMELATLHLLLLSLWSELRYWLYDGNVFRSEVNLTEMSLNTALWSSLALVYFLRAGASQSLERYYRVMSYLLLGLASVSYLLVLVPLSPIFNANSDVSTFPILNMLLLSYGVPPLIMTALYAFYAPHCRKALAIGIPLAGFIFLNLEIRHLWEPTMLFAAGMAEGELYTYSIVWLVIAVAAVLMGGTRFGMRVYQAGVALLVVVILKVFLIDTGGLEGLWRVMSYLLLGLCLLGLAYMHQRLNLGFKEDKRF